MRRLSLDTVLPLIALLLLGLLAAAAFYRQNFDQGIRFPHLGDARDSIDCASIDRDNLVVVLAVGQSIASNYGSVPHRPGKQVFSFYNGRCFVGNDPLPGADGDGGSIWSRMGDLLVQRGHAKNVLLVAIGSGGSSVTEWVPDGKLYPRLVDAARSLKLAGFKPHVVAWHQGSRDRAMDPALYGRHLRDIIYAFPFLGMPLGNSSRLFVATHTRCKSDAVPALQAAQHSVVDPARFVFAGPDMDVLGDELKYDGCHYNEFGLKLAANRWLAAIEKVEAESPWLPRVAAAQVQRP